MGLIGSGCDFVSVYRMCLICFAGSRFRRSAFRCLARDHSGSYVPRSASGGGLGRKDSRALYYLYDG